MNIFRDKQIKHFSLFIAIYSILLVGVSTWFSINQLNTAKSMYLEHDRAIVSALLEQEVSKEVIANAISSTDISTAGMEFLDNLGITTNTFGSLLPHFSQFQYHFLRIALGGGICLVIILVIGVISFLQIRICITKISTFLILCDLAVCLATLYVSFSLVFALMRYLQGKVFLIRFYSPTTLSSSRAEFRLPSRLACA